MSNICGLIVAAPSEAEEFCKAHNSCSLRTIRARYGMTNPKDESLRTETMSGCFVMVVISLDPVMLRTLLRVIRDESFADFPYPPKTRIEEQCVEKKLAEDLPIIHAEGSEPPWLWQIPSEIAEHLVNIKTKKEISRLAKLWRETFDHRFAESFSLKSAQGLIEDLQQASILALRSDKRVFLYCST